MAQFNPNKPYRIIKVTKEGVVSYEIHQPVNVSGPEGPTTQYVAVTDKPGNTGPTNPKIKKIKYSDVTEFIYQEKIKGDGSEVVFDSEVNEG